MSKPKLGYLGTGLMGLPMVLNLLKAGYDVVVWNRTASKADAAVAAGATLAESPADLAAKCDVVMACLTNAAAVEAVLFGENGVASVKGPALFVDFSSMDPELTKTYGAQLRAANGMGWIDAPVSGGTPAAEAGTLTIMAGGTEADFAVAEPLMAPIAQRVTLMGPAGAGQMTKLVNQIIAGCTMTIVAEAVNFAKKTGVDATRLTEALAGGFADSKPFQIFGPRMAKETFENPLGTVAMMLKDLDTIAAVGAGKAATPMTEAARSIMRESVNRGRGEADISTLVTTISEDS